MKAALTRVCVCVRACKAAAIHHRHCSDGYIYRWNLNVVDSKDQHLCSSNQFREGPLLLVQAAEAENQWVCLTCLLNKPPRLRSPPPQLQSGKLPTWNSGGTNEHIEAGFSECEHVCWSSAVLRVAACGLLLVPEKATGELVQWRHRERSCWKITSCRGKPSISKK